MEILVSNRDLPVNRLLLHTFPFKYSIHYIILKLLNNIAAIYSMPLIDLRELREQKLQIFSLEENEGVCVLNIYMNAKESGDPHALLILCFLNSSIPSSSSITPQDCLVSILLQSALCHTGFQTTAWELPS